MASPASPPESPMGVKRTHTEHKGVSNDAGHPHAYKYPRPGVTADSVIFCRGGSGASETLQVLLVKRKKPPYEGMWAIPGGFVDEHEDLEHAAARELQEETGLTGVPLLQAGGFGMPHRDPRGHTVTIVFLGAATTEQAASVKAADDAAEARWLGVEELPEMAFDHAEILRCCLRKLKRGIELQDEDYTRLLAPLAAAGPQLAALGRSAAAGEKAAERLWADVREARVGAARDH